MPFIFGKVLEHTKPASGLWATLPAAVWARWSLVQGTAFDCNWKHGRQIQSTGKIFLELLVQVPLKQRRDAPDRFKRTITKTFPQLVVGDAVLTLRPQAAKCFFRQPWSDIPPEPAFGVILPSNVLLPSVWPRLTAMLLTDRNLLTETIGNLRCHPPPPKKIHWQVRQPQCLRSYRSNLFYLNFTIWGLGCSWAHDGF